MKNAKYELDEIVTLPGVGAMSLRSVLERLPDEIAPGSAAFRDEGKNPAIFDASDLDAARLQSRL
jgi:hypothetical protein